MANAADRIAGGEGTGTFASAPKRVPEVLRIFRREYEAISGEQEQFLELTRLYPTLD